MRLRLSAAVFIAFCIFACQTVPLLWGRSFYLDWMNHIWLIQYYADHLKHYWSFPGTLDAAQAFGNPAPIFYGVFFYPLFSIIAAVVGADAAVRLMAVIMLLAPLVSVSLLLRNLTRDLTISILMSSVVNLSVYQMTNLYFRSALTEFFALQFLILSISLVLYGLITQSQRSPALISAGVACAAIAAGTHPITVYTFTIFIAPVIAIGLIALRKAFPARNVMILGLSLLILIACLSPWVVNTYLNQQTLQITTTNILAHSFFYFPASIDSLMGRIGFFYFDPRVAMFGIDRTSTPFLDAPFSVPSAIILIVFIFLLFFTARRNVLFIAIPTLLSLAVLLYVGLPHHAFTTLGPWPGSVKAVAEDGLIYRLLIPSQFAYRLAGTWSVALVATLFISALAIKQSGKSHLFAIPLVRRTVVLVSVFACVSASQKLALANVEFRQYPVEMAGKSLMQDSDKSILLDQSKYRQMIAETDKYPFTYLSQVDYSVPGEIPKTTSEEKVVATIAVSEWAKPIHVKLTEDGLLQTNVVPSPTTRIEIDSELPKVSSISSSGTLDFRLGAGEHTLKVTKVGRRFSAYQGAAWAVVVWLFLSLGYLALTFLGRRNEVIS